MVKRSPTKILDQSKKNLYHWQIFETFFTFKIKYDKSIVHLNKFFTSFFLDAESVGKSRAQVATQMLLELNPDVRGDYIDEGPEQILENSPDFFNSFTVVVATSLLEK